MKKILITGGTGFIGSHLAEKCVEIGYKVTVFDRYNPNYSLGNLENSKYKNKINFEFGDIRDFDSVFKVVKKNSYIFHLAALIGIPYSYISPNAYLKTNIEGTYNVLESAKLLNVKKIFITSTSEVYGSAKYTPIDESHILQPQSPYSASKISSDSLAISYYNSFKTPVTIIRPFNTFGPRQSERAIIPSIINQIKNTKSGNIYLGNINTTREFNYVEDIVNAFVKSLKIKKYGEIINIGNGYGISIKKLTNLIAFLMKKKINIKKSKERIRPKNSEVSKLVSNFNKAKKILKWTPKHKGKAGLIYGLQKTIEWNLNNKPNFVSKDKYII